MKKYFIASGTALAMSSAAFAGGGETVFDLSGTTIDAASPTTLTFEQTTAGPVDGFSWDLSYTTFGASWGSELNVFITSPGGTTVVFDGGDTPGAAPNTPSDIAFGWGDSGGTFTSAGTTDLFDGDESLGTWTFMISEEFDDFGSDGVFDAGSVFVVSKIPAPGALALLGLAGLAGRRRRA